MSQRRSESTERDGGYPLNCWYMAATSNEVGRALLGRELLGVPVVLFRQESGAVAAISGTCAHRAMPLSQGRLDGDHVVCGYHGFAFGPTGHCVRVPSQDRIPYGAGVRSYPVREDGPVVWIWMGDPATAETKAPPSLPKLQGGSWAAIEETLHVDGHYMALHENSLDLTHFPHVHPDLAPPSFRSVPPPVELTVSELSVSYRRTFPPSRLPEWQAWATGLDPQRDYAQRETGTFASPALHLKSLDIIEAGADGSAAAYETFYVRGFTPEGPSSTHVFTWVARNYAIDQDDVAEHLRTVDQQLLRQDKEIVEAIQTHAARYGEVAAPTVVNADITAMKAHEIVNRMLQRERGGDRVPARRPLSPRG